MEPRLSIYSEIGRLRTVLLHRPGDELLNLSPSRLSELLFDDIPYLEAARAEHDRFASMLQEQGVEVLYLEDLCTEALDVCPSREPFIDAFIEGAGLPKGLLAQALRGHLQSLPDSRSLVRAAMSGVRLDELELELSRREQASLADLTMLAKGHSQLLADPIPNLYFTRDCFSVVGQGVSLNRMRSVTRRRESLFAQTIFAHHPRYARPKLWYHASESPSIEGGDILVLSPTTLAIGVSERTSAEAIDLFATRLLADESEPFERVLALVIPETRAFMHLDTIFTQLDRDAFAVHPQALEQMEVYELERSRNGLPLRVRRREEPLAELLACALDLDGVRLIRCGGDDPIAAAREQWNDGANTLALSPGRVFVYQRNAVTNELLYREGFDLLEIPSAELSRGRGGPHCMSMALLRDPV